MVDPCGSNRWELEASQCKRFAYISCGCGGDWIWASYLNDLVMACHGNLSRASALQWFEAVLPEGHATQHTTACCPWWLRCGRWQQWRKPTTNIKREAPRPVTPVRLQWNSCPRALGTCWAAGGCHEPALVHCHPFLEFTPSDCWWNLDFNWSKHVQKIFLNPDPESIWKMGEICQWGLSRSKGKTWTGNHVLCFHHMIYNYRDFPVARIGFTYPDQIWVS